MIAYTDMNTVLRAAKRHVMGVTGFPSERVLIVASWKPRQHIQGDQVVELRPGSFLRRVQWSDGHSRNSSWISRELLLRPFTRLALDSTNEDELWVTSASLGHSQLEEKLIDAFDDWLPIHGGQGLLLQPSKFLDGEPAVRDERSPGNGDSILRVQLDYQARRAREVYIGG